MMHLVAYNLLQLSYLLKYLLMSDKKYLQQGDAVDKLRELATEINVCLFCTDAGIEANTGCRPMATQGVDEEGNIWFMSDRDSEKNREISLDPRVKLYYSHPGKNSFMVVTGRAEIIYSRTMIETLWNALDKTWFKKGKDDPAISLIRVRPENAHYWDVKGSQMVNFLKMVASAATGTTLVEGEEGALLVH